MKTMDESVSERVAKRVLIVVSRKSPHWDAAWASSEALVPIALGILTRRSSFIPARKTAFPESGSWPRRNEIPGKTRGELARPHADEVSRATVAALSRDQPRAKASRARNSPYLPRHESGDGNPRVSRSGIYRISVSSSVGVNS